jgi:hypothetical protein
MREETRTGLEAAKRAIVAGRLDEGFKRADGLLRRLSGKELEDVREEWSAFLWSQPGDFKELLK